MDLSVRTLYDQIWAYAHSTIKSERTHTLRSNLSVRTLYDQIWAYAHSTIKSERTHTLRSNLSVRTLYDQIWAYAHSTIKSERTHTLRSNLSVRTLYKWGRRFWNVSKHAHNPKRSCSPALLCSVYYIVFVIQVGSCRHESSFCCVPLFYFPFIPCS